MSTQSTPSRYRLLPVASGTERCVRNRHKQPPANFLVLAVHGFPPQQVRLDRFTPGARGPAPTERTAGKWPAVRESVDEGPGGAAERPRAANGYNSSRRKRAYSADNTLEAFDIGLEAADPDGTATKLANDATNLRSSHRRDT